MRQPLCGITPSTWEVGATGGGFRPTRGAVPAALTSPLPASPRLRPVQERQTSGVLMDARTTGRIGLSTEAVAGAVVPPADRPGTSTSRLVRP